MKARVQYNDVVGTSAADVSDAYKNDLQTYLIDRFKGYNSNRYYCEGCYIYESCISDKATIRFICYDNQENKYVFFTPKIDYTLSDVVNVFKRLNIVMGRQIDSIDISNDDWLDLE